MRLSFAITQADGFLADQPHASALHPQPVRVPGCAQLTINGIAAALCIAHRERYPVRPRATMATDTVRALRAHIVAEGHLLGRGLFSDILTRQRVQPSGGIGAQWRARADCFLFAASLDGFCMEQRRRAGRPLLRKVTEESLERGVLLVAAAKRDRALLQAAIERASGWSDGVGRAQ
jgi:hypothetical protein